MDIGTSSIEVSQEVLQKINKLEENIEKVIVGKNDVVKAVVVALLSQGHVLIEDVPGVGKTTLARALALSIDLPFKRIQFTPDLLPSDILGVSIYDSDKKEFTLKRGPIFGNIILADEINRSTPRTQSALLEAMNDFQVTIDNDTHLLKQPFIVIATQNPLEYVGTYPLPESQLDRFLMRIKIGYPEIEYEEQILTSHKFHHPLEDLKACISGDEILHLQTQVRNIKVEQPVRKYILDICRSTRLLPKLLAGVSPRGSLMLFRAAQAHALTHGRNYCLHDDVKAMAPPVLAHRVIEKYGANSDLQQAEAIILELLEKVPVPL